ncbi:MAG: DUF2147 domain-containing protein [Mesorhizobium sp.]
MFTRLGVTSVALLIAAGAACADPIEGNWKTQHGSNAVISACGGSFCIKLTSGEYAGKTIGSVKASGDSTYTGTITRPSNGKTYSGKAKLAGGTLTLSGCVLAVLCNSQTWTKM